MKTLKEILSEALYMMSEEQELLDFILLGEDETYPVDRFEDAGTVCIGDDTIPIKDIILGVDHDNDLYIEDKDDESVRYYPIFTLKGDA